MKELLEMRSAAVAAARAIVDGAKGRDMTSDEAKALEAKLAEIEDLDARIVEAEKSAGLIARLTGSESSKFTLVSDRGPDDDGDTAVSGSIGEQFVKSSGYRAFQKNHPAGTGSGTPIHIEARGVGGLNELGVGSKAAAATIDTTVGQFVSQNRIPGYRSTLIDPKITFLDLVTTGTTNASFIEYAQIVSENNNAAIVAEGELKPLSDLATTKADAKAFTYADGFDITNQTLSDDGALAAFMDSRLRWHLRNLLENVLLNGNGVSDPKGILNTTGVGTQAFATDNITTLAAALAQLEVLQVEPQAIVMNPADLWALRLLRAVTDGSYMLGSPYSQAANPTPFGVPLVSSSRVAAGTALVGNFSGVQLLEREPLTVTAFNQHKDYAQRNMTYVRAELRALQFVYAPREIIVATLSSAPLAAVGATAGTPGAFTPTGAVVPANLAALQAAGIAPSPATAWTTGQGVALGTGTAHWDGTAWATGNAGA